MNLEKWHLDFILPIMVMSASVGWLLATDLSLSLVLFKILFLRELTVQAVLCPYSLVISTSTKPETASFANRYSS